MQQMVDSLQSSMRLLVASVRSPDDIVALASQVLPLLSFTLHPCLLTWEQTAQGCDLIALEEGRPHAHNSRTSDATCHALQNCILLGACLDEHALAIR